MDLYYRCFDALDIYSPENNVFQKVMDALDGFFEKTIEETATQKNGLFS